MRNWSQATITEAPEGSERAMAHGADSPFGIIASGSKSRGPGRLYVNGVGLEHSEQ